MAINVKRTGSAEYGRYIKALFCGDPGAGKTLISSTFPNPVIASAEGGLMSLADRNVPFVEITESEQINQLKNIFSQPPKVREELLGVPAETFVVDTLDEIQKLLIRERLADTKQDQLKVQDWGWLGDQMRLIVRTLRNLDCHVVFTCHLKKSENSDTGAITYGPALQGAMGEEIPGYVDLAVVLKARPVAKVVEGETKRVMVRMLQTFPDASYTWLKDRSGKLPHFFEVNLNDDFDRINDLIFGQVPAEAPAEVPAGDAAQITVSIAEPIEAEAAVGPGPEEEAATAAANARYTCAGCGAGFDDEDRADLSVLKFRKLLCTECFTSHK